MAFVPNHTAGQVPRWDLVRNTPAFKQVVVDQYGECKVDLISSLMERHTTATSAFEQLVAGDLGAYDALCKVFSDSVRVNKAAWEKAGRPAHVVVIDDGPVS